MTNSIGKAVSRVIGGATLVALLAASSASAQSLRERLNALPKVSDQEIATMLTLNDSKRIDGYMAFRIDDLITVFAQGTAEQKENKPGVFMVPKYTKQGELVGLKKREYQQYGNPLGAYHQGFENPDESAFLSNMVATLLERYDGDLANMRRIAMENHLDADATLGAYQLETKNPIINGIPANIPVLTLTKPIGALRDIKIHFGGHYRRMPAVFVDFSFAPQGKEPLSCVGKIPYQQFSDGANQQKTYVPVMAGLWCKLEDKYEQVATNTEEILLDDYLKNRSFTKRGSQSTGGMISASSSGPSDLGMPGHVGEGDSVFGGSPP